MTVRDYNPETDAAMVSTWWFHRHGEEFPHALLPEVGGVVVMDGLQPVAALWLCMILGKGVAYVEYPVGVPGRSPKQAAEAFEFAQEAVERIGLAHGYNAFMVNTPPGIARVLKRGGYVFSDTPKLTGIKIIPLPV